MSLDQDIVFERKITSDRNNYIIDNSDKWIVEALKSRF